MTDREKLDAIRKETEVLSSELTEEERAFLDKGWDERSEEEKRLYYVVWRDKPDTIEHAAYNAGCTPEELATAARVIRAIRDAWIAAARTAAKEFEHILAAEVLEVIERAAEDQEGGSNDSGGE